MIRTLIDHFYATAQAQAIGMARLASSGPSYRRRSRRALARYNRWVRVRRALGLKSHDLGPNG